jgi:hypothetical protein
VSTPNKFCWGFVFLNMLTHNIFEVLSIVTSQES